MFIHVDFGGNWTYAMEKNHAASRIVQTILNFKALNILHILLLIVCPFNKIEIL